jgi:hypothetical protein
MSTAALFLLTLVLGLVSLIACPLFNRFRLVGVLCGVGFALVLFLFLALWQPFRDHVAAVHLGLIALGLASALSLRRGAPAVRTFGIGFGLILTGLSLFSAVIFPALTRPEGLAQAYAAEIEAVVGDKAYCTVASRQQSGANPSFYGARGKDDATLDWSSPGRFLYSWIDQAKYDLTLFVRTGAPELRIASEYDFETPGNFYDLAVYFWDVDTAAFHRHMEKVTVGEVTYEASAIAGNSFPCIPRKGFLLTGPPMDVVEISTPFGDFAVPKQMQPTDFIPGWYFSTRSDGFYFFLGGRDLLPTPSDVPALRFRFSPYKRPDPSLDSDVYGSDHREISSRAGLLAVGFAENQFGLLEGGEITAKRNGNAMLGFDPAGNIVTSIDCSEDNWCDHKMLGPVVLSGPGTSNRIWVSYPIDLLPHWREIEAAAKAALVTFPVPGVVPGEKLGLRPVPECIAIVENDGRCLAYDRLP